MTYDMSLELILRNKHSIYHKTLVNSVSSENNIHCIWIARPTTMLVTPCNTNMIIAIHAICTNVRWPNPFFSKSNHRKLVLKVFREIHRNPGYLLLSYTGAGFRWTEILRNFALKLYSFIIRLAKNRVAVHAGSIRRGTFLKPTFECPVSTW